MNSTEEAGEPYEKRGWHVSREIPIMLIFGIFMQTGGLVWWLSDLGAQVREVTKTTVRLERQLETLPAAGAQALINATKLSVAETELERLRTRVDAIQLELQRAKSGR
jgi:hypothetical protein